MSTLLARLPSSWPADVCVEMTSSPWPPQRHHQAIHRIRPGYSLLCPAAIVPLSYNPCSLVRSLSRNDRGCSYCIISPPVPTPSTWRVCALDRWRICDLVTWLAFLDFPGKDPFFPANGLFAFLHAGTHLLKCQYLRKQFLGAVRSLTMGRRGEGSGAIAAGSAFPNRKDP